MLDRETLRRIVTEKLKKSKNGNIPETNENLNNLLQNDTNSTEVKRDNPENVTVVTVNFGNEQREKYTVTTVTNANSSQKSSGENLPGHTEEFEEGENIEIKDNTIIIKINKGKKNQVRFEIHYGFAGTIEDITRIKDLKVPQLPQYELVAKKQDETLSMIATVDFYQMENRILYYIRDKKEVVEKLYRFKSDRRISKKLINDALNVWLDHIQPEIKWTDITEVVKDYKEWEEINRDPLGFFLSGASEVVGNEKLKIAVLLSVVSSQLKKLFGIYRVHLILTGGSGVGKSSTIKSILKMFYEMNDGVDDWVVLNVTRMTKESLGYLDIGTLDDKVLFIEQLDNIEGVSYLREAMSEGRITTLIPVKTETGEIKTIQKVIPGQPTFITTNVTANVDHQITNRSIQLYLSSIEDEKVKETIINTILMRKSIDEEKLSRLKLITYVWLKTRPNDPVFTDSIGLKVIELLKKFIKL
ncbi:hypothetical protein SSSV7_gp13 [Sulfolobus spindle-shaped virus 7]|uniref:Uncharacterized protein n=1 Tax=Sulfolobus spindle-shaped virus 7 TaxID=693628 RepID=D1GF64_9VIRU|nr:hypothetical protein SSSV7_gp13 [Sulfolobus spindle-shaped virus 7]ACZ35766.1 unknown [Sulfolobus spindle-shaped virus 7]